MIMMKVEVKIVVTREGKKRWKNEKTVMGMTRKREEEKGVGGGKA